MLRPGDNVGNYRLVRQLGAGSFGVVWLADRVTRVTTRFALKVPKWSSSDDPLPIEWQKEADRWAKLKGHPNIVPIIEADEFPVHPASTQHPAKDPVFSIVSEYVDGGTVADWLKRRSSNHRDPYLAVEMTCQILDGVSHLHRERFIHRDIKPDNVFLQGGKPRIGDFGLAREYDDTVSALLGGTPLYMAPEAFRNQRSPHLDLWSVSVMLYEMLHGHRPFSSPAEILSATPVTVSANLPAQLQRVIKKCLNKAPHSRYLNADDLRESLRGSVPLPSGRQIDAPEAVGPTTAAILERREIQRQRALEDPTQGL